MKKILVLVVFIAYSSFSQQKLFQNELKNNNLSNASKISQDLASTFINTSYYLQNSFYLKQDLIIFLPNHTAITAVYQKTITYNTVGFSAVYKILGSNHAQLVFSEVDQAITGMYQSDDNKKYIFHQTNTNVFAVAEVNGDQFNDKEKALDYIEQYDQKNGTNTFANNNVCLASTPVCAGTTTIDLMVVYTPSAKTLWGSNALANSNITTSVTNMNVALTNSGVTNVTFRLVYVAEINYIESGVFLTI